MHHVLFIFTLLLFYQVISAATQVSDADLEEVRCEDWKRRMDIGQFYRNNLANAEANAEGKQVPRRRRVKLCYPDEKGMKPGTNIPATQLPRI